MNNPLVNQDFEQAVSKLRKILPKFSFGLLIATYLISALIMGIFHSQNAPHIGFTIAAFLVPIAIQTGRGTLVFFFQLNPARIHSRYSVGVIAATALLLLSLWETWLVMGPYGLSWTVSVSTLMVIGWVIELMILRETLFATQMELHQNKAQWQELYQFYVDRLELEQFMKALHKGERPAVPAHIEAVLLETSKDEEAVPQPEDQSMEGNLVSPTENGQDFQ